MELLRIDHFTLRVAPSALPELLHFYTRVLSLRDGPRPAFSFPGHWLYAGESAVVHLAGIEPASGADEEPGRATGKLDHVSLRAAGLAVTRRRLAELAVPWREAPVPGKALHQVFVRDPIGLQIELTFDAAELAEAGAS